MTWTALLAALITCHMVGDFLLQTEAQAIGKAGGLSRDRAAQRALGAHLLTYALAMGPALWWVAAVHGGWVAAALLAGILLPHAVQDDRRLLAAYARRVKRMDPDGEPVVMLALDQACHVVTLALTALAVAT